MATPNNIVVNITAEVAGLKAGLAVAQAEASSAAKNLNALAREVAAAGSATDAQKAKLLEFGDAAAKSAAKVGVLKKEIKELSAEKGLNGLAAGIKETLDPIMKVREALMGIGEVVIAAFALERLAEWSRQMGEAAEKTKHTAEIFGMTVPQVEGLQAVATATGMPLETLTKSMGILDKNMVAAANGTGTAVTAFKALGIDAKAGGSQMQIMLAIADKFHTMADGPKKLALAMQLFGRAGKDMIPFLDQGAAGIEKLDQKSRQYAAGTLDQTAATKALRDWLVEVNEKGVALAETNNETSIAMQGASNVMTDAFAPALQMIGEGLNTMIGAFIESYRSGGTMKEIMDTLAGALRLISEGFSAFGEIIGEVWQTFKDACTEILSVAGITFKQGIPGHVSVAEGAFNDLIDIVVLSKDIIIGCLAILDGAIKVTADTYSGYCKVMWDALVDHNWSAAVADWHNTMAAIANDAQEQAHKVASAWNEAAAAVKAFKDDKNVHGLKGGGIPDIGGNEGNEPDLSKASKPKKAKKAKGGGAGHDDTVRKWQAEIDAAKIAWDQQQNLQNTSEAYSLTAEAAFWDAKLALCKAGSDNYRAVLAKSVEAHQKVVAAELDAFKKGLDDQLATAKKSVSEQEAIERQALIAAEALYGKKSDEYKAVLNDMAKTAGQAANDEVETVKKGLEAEKKAREAHASLQEKLIKNQADSSLFGGVAAAQQEGTLRIQKIQDEIAARERLHAVMLANKQDDASFSADMAELSAKSKDQQIANILAVQAAYHSYIDGIVSSTITGLDGIISGQKTWAQMGIAIYGQMVHMFEQQLERFVSQWIVQHVFMTAAQRAQLAAQAGQAVAAEGAKTAAATVGAAAQTAATATGTAAKAKIVGLSNMKEITSHAASSAAGAYNAMAAIPVIGPVLGAAAAAATFTAVEAFGALASFDKGTNMLPTDMLAQVHAGERIVPAADNKAMIAALNGGGGNTANDNRRGGDTHVNYAPTINGHMPFADQLAEHESNIISMMKKAHRNGTFR